MENRRFSPSISRHPERKLLPDQLDDEVSMKPDDEVGEQIWDISRINEEPPVDDDKDTNDDDEDDEGEPDYDTDIKPYHKVPVQRDGHAEPPTPVEDIPYDEEQDAEWHRRRQNPDDPDSVSRGVWKMEGDK